jgi:hypothetical protein
MFKIIFTPQLYEVKEQNGFETKEIKKHSNLKGEIICQVQIKHH